MDKRKSTDPRIEIFNNDERCACVLVLDVSGSMGGDPIDALNQGLAAFATQIKKDELAARRIEVAMVTFGGNDAELVHDFLPAKNFDAPTLEADGATPMGSAVEMGLQILRNRKNEYRKAGIQYYRPWLVLMTDGEPTDEGWEQAAAAVRREEQLKGVSCFPIGVGPAVNMEKLSRFSGVRPPLSLIGLDFASMFDWLSKSLQVVSLSGPGDMTALPVASWGAVTA